MRWEPLLPLKTTLRAAVLAAAALAALPAGFVLFDAAMRGSRADTHSFPSYYTASKLLVSGAPLDRLEDRAWFREETRKLGFAEPDVFWGNPPPAALVMAPLAYFFSPATARRIWTWASVVFWLAGVELMRRSVLRRLAGSMHVSAALGFGSFAALFAPVHANLELGQIYLLLFFVQTAACAFWLDGRSFLAGVAAGVLLALKGYGVLFLGLAALMRDRPFVKGAVLSFGALAGLTWAFTGSKPWIDFFSIHFTDPRFSDAGTPVLQTLKSLFWSLGGLVSSSPAAPSVPRSLPPAIFALVSGALQLLLLTWLATFRKGAPGSAPPKPLAKAGPSAFALSACIAASLLFSPRGTNHAYCFSLTALGLMLPSLGNLGRASALVTASILLAFPFPFRERPITSAEDLFVGYPRFWGALVLLAAALYSERASARTESSPD